MQVLGSMHLLSVTVDQSDHRPKRRESRLMRRDEAPGVAAVDRSLIVENTSRVNAGLTILVGEAHSVAYESADLGNSRS
jgi:hypothetical protein